MTAERYTVKEVGELLGIPVKLVQELIDEKRVLPSPAAAKYDRRKWVLHEVRAAMHTKIGEETGAGIPEAPPLGTKREWVEFIRSVLTHYRNGSPEAVAQALYKAIASRSMAAVRVHGRCHLFGLGVLNLEERKERKAYSPTKRSSVRVPAGTIARFKRSRKLNAISKEKDGE